MPERQVDVVVQIDGTDVAAGRLWAHRQGRTESQTFAYDADYLARHDAYELDPALPLTSGAHHTDEGRAIFGAFSDCAPDRWGRRLAMRAEHQRERSEGGGTRAFGEIDFLLRVRDDLRQGAIRFRDPHSESYLTDDATAVRPLVDLPRLLDAADHLERNEATPDELHALLNGGSSLGGARPKAHVRDQDGSIAIAKFPSPANDEWDVMAWEALALRLARSAGIRVPAARSHRFGPRTVVIVDRFDRDGSRRIGYRSAMTALEAQDGEPGSYLEIAEAIEATSPQTTLDLHELWRRVAFSILISNFDDHLRNHGFLRTSNAGWVLSPAFDLNPDPRPGDRHLHTAIDFDDTAARVDLLLDVADAFRLDRARALTVLAEVVAATRTWRRRAQASGIAVGEVELLAPAFEHAEAIRARDLTGV